MFKCIYSAFVLNAGSSNRFIFFFLSVRRAFVTAAPFWAQSVAINMPDIEDNFHASCTALETVKTDL